MYLQAPICQELATMEIRGSLGLRELVTLRE